MAFPCNKKGQNHHPHRPFSPSPVLFSVGHAASLWRRRVCIVFDDLLLFLLFHTLFRCSECVMLIEVDPQSLKENQPLLFFCFLNVNNVQEF